MVFYITRLTNLNLMNTDSLINSVNTQPYSEFNKNRENRQAQKIVLRSIPEHYYQALFKYIQLAAGQILTEIDRGALTGCLKFKKLRRRQYFLQEGDACKYIAFLVKGATKMYSINVRGQESVIALNMENDWVTDFESFFEGSQSNFHIEAVEEVELVLFDRAQLFVLIEKVPAFTQMFNQFQLKQMIMFQKRINSSLSMTAEERYLDLISTKPEFAIRFSQNILACYLGIKPETLSRIRKQ